MNKVIKQDINFLEYPLWYQNERMNVNAVNWTDRDGYVFECSRSAPTKVDILFLYFILLECQKNGWNPEVVLTRYQILNGCKMNTGAVERKRLKKSLEKWKRVTISFNGIFYNEERYETLEFGIINDWRIQKEDGKLKIELNRFWIQKIRESEFFKYVSFSQMRQLRSPLALRLYEILVKTFHKRKTWEIDIQNLAAKIPMSEKYIAHIIPKIQAATKRIRDKTDINIKVQVVKQGRGRGKFIFSKSAKQKPQQQTLLPPKETDTLPEIPAELLSLLPLPDRAGCMNLCRKIFTDDGADGLRFYLEKTNARKQSGNSSYSGYLKTVFDLNLYAAHLATKQAQEEQGRAEQTQIQKQLKKQQEEDVRHQEQQMQMAALKQLERDHPEKYQKLYDQAVRDLSINPDRPKRGDKLKVVFKLIESMEE